MRECIDGNLYCYTESGTRYVVKLLSHGKTQREQFRGPGEAFFLKIVEVLKCDGPFKPSEVGEEFDIWRADEGGGMCGWYIRPLDHAERFR